MMTRDGGKNRGQIEFTSLDELVPEDHLVRKLENAIDWSFIYEMVEDSYCENNGRPGLDPVILIKLPVLQYMFGIRSMRQTIQEIKVNNAYRWFLGLGLHDPVPHFSTFAWMFHDMDRVLRAATAPPHRHHRKYCRGLLRYSGGVGEGVYEPPAG